MHPAVVPLLAVAIAALTASNVVWLTGVPLPSFTADSHGAVHGGSAGQHGAPASRGGDDGAGDAGNADDPVRMGARRLQAVYSPSSELPAASAMWGSWSQVVAGTPESYYAEELVKPQHRFAHSATAVPMLCVRVVVAAVAGERAPAKLIGAVALPAASAGSRAQIEWCCLADTRLGLAVICGFSSQVRGARDSPQFKLLHSRRSALGAGGGVQAGIAARID